MRRPRNHVPPSTSTRRGRCAGVPVEDCDIMLSIEIAYDCQSAPGMRIEQGCGSNGPAAGPASRCTRGRFVHEPAREHRSEMNAVTSIATTTVPTAPRTAPGVEARYRSGRMRPVAISALIAANVPPAAAPAERALLGPATRCCDGDAIPPAVCPAPAASWSWGRWIEIDADGHRGGCGPAEEPPVDPPRTAVGRVDAAAPDPGVVLGQQVRRAGAPLSLGLEANSRVRREVVNVTAMCAVLGDQPESLAVQSVPDRRLAQQAGAAPRGLQQRQRGGNRSEPHAQPYLRIEHVLLHRAPQTVGFRPRRHRGRLRILRQR